jgi:hypothetical protein
MERSGLKHSEKEYARGDVTTNTVEGYFSIFKRGMRGVYQHCAEKHLHRYLAKFDFRYNYRASSRVRVICYRVCSSWRIAAAVKICGRMAALRRSPRGPGFG